MRQNIVFLLNSTYPCYTGGRETWIYNITKRLCVEHNIFIISEMPNARSSVLYGKMPEMDARIHLIHAKGCRNTFLSLIMSRSYLRVINMTISMHTMKNALKRVLNSLGEQKCYVISMDTVYPGRVAMWAKEQYSNVCFINSVRCPHAELYGNSFPMIRNYFNIIELKTLRNADQVWSNGVDTQAYIENKGMPSIVIKNGVDKNRLEESVDMNEKYFPICEAFHVLSIGTLLPIKGYTELIQAIALIKKEHGIIVTMTAFGKGNPSNYLALAQQEGVANQMCFAGFESQTVEYARYFDAVTCLSGGSGLSMACLEALLSGTPVIAWDSPVYRQMIQHKTNGYLVEENNVSSLASGILWLIEHPEERAMMGKTAQIEMEQYDWNVIADSIIRTLRCDVC